MDKHYNHVVHMVVNPVDVAASEHWDEEGGDKVDNIIKYRSIHAKHRYVHACAYNFLRRQRSRQMFSGALREPTTNRHARGVLKGLG